MDPIETTRKGVDYVIRWYEPGDGAGVRELLATVAGEDPGGDWFERLYVDNPYVDHVPLVVTETDGRIVGARPFSAYRVRVGDATELVLLTRDTMVHPDHQRRGLFTTMTEVALERYVGEEPAFAFSHSNANSRPGYRSMGWRYLGPKREFFRFHDAAAFVSRVTRDRIGRVLAPTAAVLARGYRAYRDRRASTATDVAVERRPTVPADLLASLYDRRPPGAIHPVRDPAFYRWRFAVPGLDACRTYVATRDDEPVAAMVVGGAQGSRTWLTVEDVVPMAGGTAWRRDLDALLGRIASDHADDELVRLPNAIVPRELRRARGFVSGRSFPLAALTGDPLQLGVRSLAEEGTPRIGERSFEAAAPYLWSVS